MEEILASIRRIIAEDPPGSRPEPEAKPASPARAAEEASAKPAFGPLSTLDATPETSNGDSGLAAQTRETTSESKPFLAGFFSHRPAFDGARAQPDSQADTPLDAPTRSLASTMPQVPTTGIDAHRADVPGAPAKGTEPALQTPTLSIGTLPAHNLQETSKDSVQAALDSLGAPARSENRPGFTVSREGYLAEGPKNAEAAKPAPISREPDPFEFTLGPSPFARKFPGSEAAPIQPQPAEGRRDPFGSFIPKREAVEPSAHVDTQTATPATPFTAAKPAEPDFGVLSTKFGVPETAFEESVSAPPAAPPAAEPAPTPAAEASVANAALVEDPFGEITFRPSPLLAATRTSATVEPASEAPQVSSRAVLEQLVRSTTSAPAAFAAQDTESGTIFSTTPADGAQNVLEDSDSEAERANTAVEPEAERGMPALSDIAPRSSETEGSSFDFNTAAGVTETEAPDVEVVEPENDDDTQADHQKAFDPYYADPEKEAESYTQPNEGRSLVPHDRGGHNIPAQRTMEDTVAELLRPMLKTWLAENMPRIVERALRKELADSSRAQHKPAAE